MSPNVAILGLRIAALVLLYLFLAAMVAIMWRDWRAVARQVQHTRQAATRSWGRLVVVEAGQADLSPGQALPLSIVTSLGRGPSNTVMLDVPFASNEHALLSRHDERWWLEDLNSKNGTLLNGQRLTSPAILATGDEVSIGGVRLRIELESS